MVSMKQRIPTSGLEHVEAKIKGSITHEDYHSRPWSLAKLFK